MRAPIGNPFGTETESDQHKWTQELPSLSDLQTLQEQYPPVQHPANPPAFDLQTRPWGCITSKGLQHLHSVGAQLRAHFPVLSALGLHPAPLMKVCATNYQRTQASAQAFLSGLGVATGTPIEVRDVSHCAMSFYHGQRTLAATLSRRIRSSAPFLALQAQVMSSLSSLQGAFPAMDFENVNWILVADSLTCQLAHNYALHPAVEPHSDLLRGNAVQRFVEHYKDGEFLAHFAGPLLRDVLDEVDAAVTARLAIPCARSHCPQVTIFSGHDVNLLGMLFALNAVVDDDHWPSYGSTLSLEVVEVVPVAEEGEEEEEGTPLVPSLSREALLSRLRIYFHYCSGEEGQPVAALPLHKNRSVFDKRGGKFTSREEVAATLAMAQSEGEEAPVVTYLSYAEFELLYNTLVAPAHSSTTSEAASRNGKDRSSGGGVSGFI